MAEQEKKKPPPTPTERVVLKRIVLTSGPEGELPDGLADDVRIEEGIGRPDGSIEAWAPVLNSEAQHGPDGQVRIFRATSKKAAIEQYAGKDGKDRPGFYRAPSLRSWREQHGWVEPTQQPLDHVTED
jgi:hypothetical protein